jgi:endo-1,4-beta-xylanase
MNEDARSKGLKDYHKDYFPVGVAVSPGALKNDEAPLISGSSPV